MSSSTSTISSKIPPSRKDFFHSGSKSSHAAKCAKSSPLTKVIGLILEIDSFGKKCDIVKGLLQSDPL